MAGRGEAVVGVGVPGTGTGELVAVVEAEIGQQAGMQMQCAVGRAVESVGMLLVVRGECTGIVRVLVEEERPGERCYRDLGRKKETYENCGIVVHAATGRRSGLVDGQVFYL